MKNKKKTKKNLRISEKIDEEKSITRERVKNPHNFKVFFNTTFYHSKSLFIPSLFQIIILLNSRSSFASIPISLPPLSHSPPPKKKGYVNDE